MIIIAIFMIVIVKSWLIIISSYIAIVHVTTVDVLRAHAPSKMVQMPAALADLANMRWWSLDWIGLDWIGLPLCWRSSSDLRTPGSDLHPSVGRGTGRSGCQSQCSHPAPSSSPLMMMMMYQGWGWSWWWFFGPNLVTHHLGLLLWWWWWCTKQGGIKCGKRGRGFLDSEGSHW